MIHIFLKKLIEQKSEYSMSEIVKKEIPFKKIALKSNIISQN